MSWSGPLVPVGPALHEIPATYTGERGDLRMRVPGRIVADADLLPHIQDDLAPEQVANVATLPGIVGASLAMPDIHWGYGFPIGGVAAFDPDEDGVVSPGGVGFDINCGVRLLWTDLHVEDVMPRLQETMDTLFQAVPAGMGSKGKAGISERDLDSILTEGAVWAVENGHLDAGEREAIEDHGRIPDADPSQVSDRARLRGRRSLGSLGSGNHFLELQVVEEVVDPDRARRFGLRPGTVCVMVHSGSRGLGHQVCQDFVGRLQDAPRRYGITLPDRQLACAPLGSRAADAYLGAMAAAANYAFVNRSLLARRATDALETLFPGMTSGTVYDVCHNIAKWEEHQDPVDPRDPDAGPGPRRRVLVHRKGATRAFPPGHPALASRFQETGQPVAVPGDMGRASWVLAGAAGSMANSFGSSCHGAGRRLSRTAAKKQYQGADLIRDLWERAGIVVRATSAQVAAEEAPGAYKDVSAVVQAVETAGLADRVARLRPLGVVKG